MMSLIVFPFFAALAAALVLLLVPINGKQAHRLQRLEGLFRGQIAPLVRELDQARADALAIRAKRIREEGVSKDPRFGPFLSHLDQFDGLGHSPAADRAREIRERLLPDTFRDILRDLDLPQDRNALATIHLGAMALWSDRPKDESIDWQYRSDLERLLAK